MKKPKISIPFKVLIGYLLLFVFGALTVWFVYTNIVELNKPSTKENNNKKMTLISEAATRLYMAEGISRNIIQNKDTTDIPRFQRSIDTISSILDSLKTLYTNTTTPNELDSIHHLLTLKEENLNELVELSEKNKSENYYDRVIQRLEQADYLFGSSDYKEMVKGLKPYQQKVLLDYIKYGEKENADRLTNRTINSMVETMKKVLASLEMQEHRYQQNLAEKEDKLLANDVKISNRLRKIRAKIEQEEIRVSVARIKSTQETLDKTTKIMIIFGVAGVIITLIFVILVTRDINKSRRYRLALEKAKTYSESLLKSREQIMATVTHDLRSPLNSILGYSDLLRKTSLNPKQNTYLRHLKKSSDYTMRLVNDLLDFSRLESGKIRIEKLPFVPEDMIKDSLTGNIPSPDPKKLQIKLDLEETFQHTFLSDPFRLRQILANLIGNAYKFTDVGSLVIRGKIYSEKKKKYLEISVKDSGIGIPKEEQAQIFQEFSQATSSGKKGHSGFGLGLAISQKLASLLEGKIELESEQGRGSTFILTVPVEQSIRSSAKKEEQHLVLKGANREHLLVVEDNDTQRELTTEILKHQGFRFQMAENGEEALAKMKQHNFDAVLTDIQMPKLDGFELLKALKKNESLRQIPVIALSGEAHKSKSIYLDKGFSAYLLKPFEANALLQILAELLQLKIQKISVSQSTTTKSIYYDLDDLKKFTDGDPESLKSIMQSFMENTRESLKSLNTACEEKDWEQVSFYAHRMLPMLRQIKAKHTIDALDRLERQESEGLSGGEIKFLVKEGTRQVDVLLEELEANLG